MRVSIYLSICIYIYMCMCIFICIYIYMCMQRIIDLHVAASAADFEHSIFEVLYAQRLDFFVKPNGFKDFHRSVLIYMFVCRIVLVHRSEVFLCIFRDDH